MLLHMHMPRMSRIERQYMCCTAHVQQLHTCFILPATNCCAPVMSKISLFNILLLLQALTLAPLFVWFELLFLVGYRPQLYAQLQKNVVANVAKFRAQGKVATE
eukprot:GHUV01028336.1.p3 GENE.GHUV01028336.1~~GHUV01028336.1.p3  ORF type:complete len:104 (-),score=15.93 GHUV01028336.1:128-439(-)